MSYEGYVQVICKNGHLDHCPDDCLYDEDEPCEYCGAEIVWRNHVDDTNCEDYGYIDMDKLELAPLKPATAVDTQQLLQKQPIVYQLRKKQNNFVCIAQMVVNTSTSIQENDQRSQTHLSCMWWYR